MVMKCPECKIALSKYKIKEGSNYPLINCHFFICEHSTKPNCKQTLIITDATDKVIEYTLQTIINNRTYRLVSWNSNGESQSTLATVSDRRFLGKDLIKTEAFYDLILLNDNTIDAKSMIERFLKLVSFS
jgi:hypothetical protein